LRGENKKKILWKAFENAAPYFSDIKRMKNIVKSKINNITSINEVLQVIRNMIINEKDIEIRTDLKILLNEIKKEIARMGKEYGKKI